MTSEIMPGYERKILDLESFEFCLPWQHACSLSTASLEERERRLVSLLWVVLAFGVSSALHDGLVHSMQSKTLMLPQELFVDQIAQSMGCQGPPCSQRHAVCKFFQ